MIDNCRKRIDLIGSILTKSLKLFSKLTQIENYHPMIIKSGIQKFNGTKIYIDTASAEGLNNIVDGEIINYDNRPSRANMQPSFNSIWFAKMKESNKKIIISNNDDDLVKNYIFSTGFLGLQFSDLSLFTFLSAVIISKEFDYQRDINTIGTTQESINNETFLKIKVPLINKEELIIYHKKYGIFVDELSLLRKKDKHAY